MDTKRYYYLKLKENFFDSDEIKILESLPNGIYYSNLLMKLYLKSLKCNGALRFNEYISYDENMIAVITNLDINIVRDGLKILSSMKLIEKLDDGTIYIMNIQSFIGKSSNEADRKRTYRNKIAERKLQLEESKDNSSDFLQPSEEVPEQTVGQILEECTQNNEHVEDECYNENGTNCGQIENEFPCDNGTNCTDFLDKYPPEIEIRAKDRYRARYKDRDRYRDTG